MTRNLFEGKNVLVVGGNSGIGLAAAKAFSQEGANLIITGRNVETLTSKADEIGGRTSAYQCDVTDMEQDIDFETKEQLGNFPQAYSHLALVNTAVLFAEEDKRLIFK